ncbi:MAG: biotin synthase BioB [Parachlamydiaceae bacterium]|nr:biotin synthase BioB [Parachlamydiaceae bacterium]
MKNYRIFMKTLDNLIHIHDQPLLELIAQAHSIHSIYHNRQEIQVCSLISIKTGGCPEDCKYCAQSSRYQTSTSAQPMMSTQQVLLLAQTAVAQGATRVCLGAAWREIRENKQFDQVVQMVKSITDLGIEVCCTLGMVQPHQAERLKAAGLYAYNHNLDSSESFYKTIITTRSYQDRLKTLDIIEQAGITVCCGAILGMGETKLDRLQFLHTLSQRTNPPESIPINRLAAIPGTPLEKQPLLSIWEVIRMIATTRVIFPNAMVRLSAGRLEMTQEQHALCFLAGANSIFSCERLLTIANPSADSDTELFELLGLKRRPAFSKGNP